MELLIETITVARSARLNVDAVVKSDNPPRRHHYIPEFYQKRWAGSDGRLCVFAKHRGKVVALRRHPKQTGFQDRLYSVPDMPPDIASAVETHFFKPVDSRAADALKLMEAEGNGAEWSPALRSAWSRFLHSLLVRCPEDLSLFRTGWNQLLESDPTGQWEERYRALRQGHHPPTMRAFIESLPAGRMAYQAMRAFTNLIDNPSLGKKMNNLAWWVISTSTAKHDMFTSDRPIIRTNGLMADGGHLAIPIGPRRLFVAAKDQNALDRILALPINNLVAQVNESVVSHAIRFVYGRYDGGLRFVEKHMGGRSEPRLMESVLKPDRHREYIPTVDEILSAP